MLPLSYRHNSFRVSRSRVSNDIRNSKIVQPLVFLLLCSELNFTSCRRDDRDCPRCRGRSLILRSVSPILYGITTKNNMCDGHRRNRVCTTTCHTRDIQGNNVEGDQREYGLHDGNFSTLQRVCGDACDEANMGRINDHVPPVSLVSNWIQMGYPNGYMGAVNGRFFYEVRDGTPSHTQAIVGDRG